MRSIIVFFFLFLFIQSSIYAQNSVQKLDPDSKKAKTLNTLKYEKMKNPTDANVDLDIGKSVYSKHCKSCHGKKGYGDGSKAASMKTEMRSFASAEFQAQSDGTIFYQSFIGRDEMPNFEKKIPDDEDKWALVNFLRTIK